MSFSLCPFLIVCALDNDMVYFILTLAPSLIEFLVVLEAGRLVPETLLVLGAELVLGGVHVLAGEALLLAQGELVQLATVLQELGRLQRVRGAIVTVNEDCL